MHGGFAGHGGLWAIHYALRWIVVTAPAVRIPISASGGAASGEDVVKYLLVGANNVQVCTAIYVEGFEVLQRIKAGLEEFMARKGYERLDDFRGKVCGTVLPMQEVDRSFKVVAAIEAEKCTGCGLCQRICLFDGPEPQGQKYVIGPGCRGCGLCAELCPPRAIALVPRRGGS
ncbi:MAG: dihydroorotate dehydrogenase, partial [Bacillota bacterium]|nr:dihydroorotate dehydrogenase [Bacillota bacterium]